MMVEEPPQPQEEERPERSGEARRKRSQRAERPERGGEVKERRQRTEVRERTERRKKREMRQKRMWVHPKLSQYSGSGHFTTFYRDLRQDPDNFSSFCRLSIAAYDRLLEWLRPGLTFQDTNMRRCISPEERLMVTLRFLATGNSFTSLHLEFLLGISTIAGIVRSTCDVIWDKLVSTVMPQPTDEQWMEIADGFYSASQFPNCIGALDGKHIRVRKPPHSGERYSKYNQYFSVVLLALVDSKYRFVTINIETYGSTADARNSKAFKIGQKALTSQLAIPKPRKLSGTSGPTAPFVIVADEGFGLSTNVMRPYPRRGLDDRRRVFNYRLTRARQFAKCAFGMLANKWQIFMTPIRMHPKNVDSVIKACLILHNYAQIYDSALEAEVAEHHGTSSARELGPQARPGASGLSIRDMYADYFLTPEGAVPWQQDSIP